LTQISLPWDADWIVGDQICAMSLPVESGIERLAELGFTLVVSVASEDYAEPIGEWCRLHGLRWLRYHVPDMASPEDADIRDFIAEVRSELDSGGKVAVHCLGGVGRTGTMVACYLAAQGMTAEAAIEEVRRQRPGSIQTVGQERAILRYAAEART
jgi:atypical dual specificity phosphatase